MISELSNKNIYDHIHNDSILRWFKNLLSLFKIWLLSIKIKQNNF